MADTPVQRQVTPVDPMFPIPAGATDLVYGTASGTGGLRADNQPLDNYTGSPVDPSNVGQVILVGQVDVPVPSIVGIVSQQVRRAPSGDNVIDVVVEVSEVVGATKYEFRVTKI